MGATEEQAISRAISTLCEQFPQLPADRVEAVVTDTRAEYADRRIREFIPLFVERKARRLLESYAPALG